MNLHESGEMYLETILILKNKKSNVRSIDISEEMNFSKPSVSRAVGILKDGGFITVDKNGYIDFTDEGEEIARKIYERHNVLSELLMSIGVSRETAIEDACRVEHVISDETFETIKRHVAESK